MQSVSSVSGRAFSVELLPPLQLFTKLIVFNGIVFSKMREPLLSLLHDA